MAEGYIPIDVNANQKVVVGTITPTYQDSHILYAYYPAISGYTTKGGVFMIVGDTGNTGICLFSVDNYSIMYARNMSGTWSDPPTVKFRYIALYEKA